MRACSCMRTRKRVPIDASTRGRLAALAGISKVLMSILNYFKAPDLQADDDPSTDSSPAAGESQSGEMSSLKDFAKAGNRRLDFGF